MLADEPERELKLQAIRIGDLGIAPSPTRSYALTGLKIKARSPLPATFTIELANGSEGYIPPPEQHALGGYTTWAARTAGLEVQAEPKILDAVLGLLEEVSGKPRRREAEVRGAYAEAVTGFQAGGLVASGRDGAAAGGGRQRQRPRRGTYEDGVVFALDGPALQKDAGRSGAGPLISPAGG